MFSPVCSISFCVLTILSCLDAAETLKYTTTPRSSIIVMDMEENTSIIVDCIPLGFSLFTYSKYLCTSFLFFTTVPAFFMLCSVSGRRYSEPPFEYIAKIIRICIAYLPCNDIAFIVRLDQQAGSLIHAVVRQISDKGSLPSSPAKAPHPCNYYVHIPLPWLQRTS